MDKTKLIQGLNRDLADELGTICRYIQQSARMKPTTPRTSSAS